MVQAQGAPGSALEGAAVTQQEANIPVNGNAAKTLEAPEESEIERIRRVEKVGIAERKGRTVIRPSREELARLSIRYSRGMIGQVYGVSSSVIYRWRAEDARQNASKPRAVSRKRAKPAPRKVTKSSPTAIKAAFGSVRDLLSADVIKKEAELTAARDRLAWYDAEVLGGVLKEVGIVPASAVAE